MAPYNATNDQALLEQLALGNHAAFTKLYHKYNRKVFSFALRILHSETLAQEVMHETMLKVWRLKNRALQVENLEAYLRISARNISLNMLRRMEVEKRSKTILTKLWSDEDYSTEEGILLNDAKRILNEAIEKLPGQQQRVFRLCHVQGLKYEEAAQLMGISPNTVAGHMKQALKFIRNYMRKANDILAIMVLLRLF